MPFVLQTLPFEIIELISRNSNNHDLLNAIQVSKTWHSSFYTFLYRHVFIDNHERLYRILSAFKTDILPGHFVRSLTLLNVELSQDNLLYIIDAFPDIDTFNIDWNIWSSFSCDTHFDTNAPISFIHPPQGLPPTIYNLFHHYGSNNLRNLSIDTLNNETTDIWSILALCPRLKSLRLVNLNYEHIITLGYIEMIHQLCPYLTSLEIKCTRADPSPTLLPEFNDSDSPILFQSTLLNSFSLSSKSGSTKWPLWLPYFAVKYPHLQHLSFKHCGLGKDEDGGCNDLPDRAYTMFTQACSQLKSIRWDKIILQHNQKEGLFNNKTVYGQPPKQPFLKLERIDGYENFFIPDSLVNSPLTQPDSIVSNLLTSLTIGQPPTKTSTKQVMKAVGQCKNLIHLKIQECYVGPELTYDIEDILVNCKTLQSLYIKDVHVGAAYDQTVTRDHPLKKLILKRSSLTQGVFKRISAYCTHLNHVELLGCFQSDRRDQVVIDLPVQTLKTLKIQGLRTRSYYAGCRIRFFSISTAQSNDWYYMNQYDICYHPVGQKTYFQKFRNMEFARSLERLDDRDVEELKPLVTTKTLKAWDIKAVKNNLYIPHTLKIDQSCWDPENVYYSGFVNVVCQSVENLSINNLAIK
ncbi:hypothetical protein INT48_004089 [Thamnidium elegans]|uniref:F-box domain-containing protein n=1 Tax=Thamnidium elegans TaxID=101142 RepID=A0A8H7VNR0_9FUNG|nr:hypothetical protein INT48_004089 [Thamnidium elegans]